MLAAANRSPSGDSRWRTSGCARRPSSRRSQQLLVVVRLLDRLGRQAEMLDDDLAWLSRQPWTLRAQRFPVLVQAPHHVRHPGKPALGEREAETREFLERPLADEADYLRLERLRH